MGSLPSSNTRDDVGAEAEEGLDQERDDEVELGNKAEDDEERVASKGDEDALQNLA